uniref:Putative secreted protein n=1 Tax=Anopheles triannulatus TaxID=58253 RepID=A0A2M4B4S2_9DIPT
MLVARCPVPSTVAPPSASTSFTAVSAVCPSVGLAFHFCINCGSCCLEMVWNLTVNTRSIVMSSSRDATGSASLFCRMHSTRFSSSLQDIVCMLVGSDSSWMFFANRCTAFESACRLRCCRM